MGLLIKYLNCWQRSQLLMWGDSHSLQERGNLKQRLSRRLGRASWKRRHQQRAKKVVLITWQTAIGLSLQRVFTNPTFTVGYFSNSIRHPLTMMEDECWVRNNPLTQCRRMRLLTILAAGSVEPRRTVAKLGGSLPTLAPVEAHAVATHSCTDRRGGEKRQRQKRKGRWVKRRHLDVATKCQDL